MKYLKRILIVLLIGLAGFSIGVFVGKTMYKRQIEVSGIAYWMMGVDSLKKADYDYALLYLIQAIALKNNDPLFYEALGEVYAAKGNKIMALEFYKLALDEYKKEKARPTKLLEDKIRLLQNETAKSSRTNGAREEER